MRLCARGPSGTLTASHAGGLQRRGRASSILVASTPRGGTISTDVTNSLGREPRRPLRALRERDGLRTLRLGSRDSGLDGGTVVLGRISAPECRGIKRLEPRDDRRKCARAWCRSTRRRPSRPPAPGAARTSPCTPGSPCTSAPADIARHAGVRLRAELLRRQRRHLLDRLENRLRADRAVEADDVGAPRVERARDVLGRRAEGVRPSAPIVICAITGMSWVDVARGADRLLDLLEVAERSREEAVDAAFARAPSSVRGNRARLLAARRAVGLEADAERARRRRPRARVARPPRARSRAAARLNSPTCASSPCCASFSRFAPKLFVSSTSAPAFTYAACTSRTRSGARTFSSS